MDNPDLGETRHDSLPLTISGRNTTFPTTEVSRKIRKSWIELFDKNSKAEPTFKTVDDFSHLLNYLWGTQEIELYEAIFSILQSCEIPDQSATISDILQEWWVLAPTPRSKGPFGS